MRPWLLPYGSWGLSMSNIKLCGTKYTRYYIVLIHNLNQYYYSVLSSLLCNPLLGTTLLYVVPHPPPPGRKSWYYLVLIGTKYTRYYIVPIKLGNIWLYFVLLCTKYTRYYLVYRYFITRYYLVLHSLVQNRSLLRDTKQYCAV